MKFIILFLISFNLMAASSDSKYNLKQNVSGTASTVSSLALDGFTDRCALIISNNGAVTLTVKIGSAHVGTEGIPVAAGTSWQPVKTPVGPIYVKTGSSSVPYEIVEGSCI